MFDPITLGLITIGIAGALGLSIKGAKKYKDLKTEADERKRLQEKFYDMGEVDQQMLKILLEKEKKKKESNKLPDGPTKL